MTWCASWGVVQGCADNPAQQVCHLGSHCHLPAHHGLGLLGLFCLCFCLLQHGHSTVTDVDRVAVTDMRTSTYFEMHHGAKLRCNVGIQVSVECSR